MDMIYWMVQYKLNRGWAHYYPSIAMSRKQAIANYLKDGLVGSWRKEQKRGHVRCVKVKIELV